MNILFLTTHINTGGITSYLLTLTRELVRKGHNAFVVSSSGNCLDEFLNSKVSCETFNIRTKSELNPKIYAVLPALSRFIDQHNIQVIHAHTRVTQVMGCLLQKMKHIPLVSTCHGFFKPRLSRRIFACWGEAVIAISPAVKQHLINDFHLPEDRVCLIRNGIALDRFSPFDQTQRDRMKQKWSIPPGPVLGIIARLSDVKGHQILIDAVPKVKEAFPNVHLVIVGTGKMEQGLKQQVAGLNLNEQVAFLPAVNKTEGLLPLFDIFVMPSLQEGLGLSIMEAQAAGTPVVASRVGGIPELIRQNETGMLVEPSDPQKLAEAIIELLRDPQKAASMGRRARDFIHANCSSVQMAQLTIDFYEKVLDAAKK